MGTEDKQPPFGESARAPGVFIPRTDPRWQIMARKVGVDKDREPKKLDHTSPDRWRKRPGQGFISNLIEILKDVKKGWE